MSLKFSAFKMLFLSALLLGLGLGAEAETLKGFQLNSSDDGLTVTLETDKPVQVEKRANPDGGVTLVIPKAKLSNQLIRKGLPVVLDNNNRFMGRAVPAGQDGVKIVLPNVPSSQIDVTIAQRRGQAAPAKEAKLRPTGSRPGRQAKPSRQAAGPTKKALAPVTLAQALDPNADAPSKAEAAKQWEPLINSLKAPVPKVSTKQPKPKRIAKRPPSKQGQGLIKDLAKNRAKASKAENSPSPSSLIASVNIKPSNNGPAVSWEPKRYAPVKEPFLNSNAVQNADWLAPYVVNSIQATAPAELMVAVPEQTGGQTSQMAEQADSAALPAWLWIVVTTLALTAGIFAWRWLQARYRATTFETESGDTRPRPIMRRQRPNTYAPMSLQSSYGQAKASFNIPKTPSMGPRCQSIYQHSETLLANATATPALYRANRGKPSQ